MMSVVHFVNVFLFWSNFSEPEVIPPFSSERATPVSSLSPRRAVSSPGSPAIVIYEDAPGEAVGGLGYLCEDGSVISDGDDVHEEICTAVLDQVDRGNVEAAAADVVIVDSGSSEAASANEDCGSDEADSLSGARFVDN